MQRLIHLEGVPLNFSESVSVWGFMDLTNTQEEYLSKIATSKTVHLKGQWVSAGYETWSAVDPVLGPIYLKLRNQTSYSTKNRTRIESKTRNCLVLSIGTSDGIRYVENGHTVMEAVSLGEDFAKQEALKAKVAKRLLSRFGIVL